MECDDCGKKMAILAVELELAYTTITFYRDRISMLEKAILKGINTLTEGYDTPTSIDSTLKDIP